MPDFLQPYIIYLLTAALGCVISIYGVRKTIFIARTRNLYDKPDDIRKIHGKEIPSMGGIGIFVGYVIASAVYWYWCGIFLPFLMASSAMLLFTGIYDDIMNMRAVKKLAAQLVASFVTLCIVVPLFFMHNGELSNRIISSLLPIVVTTLFCTFFINVFNFIDGIDGLASSLAILYLTTLGFVLCAANMNAASGLSFTAAGATLGLLFFNKPPARIYMGDTGSMFVGFTIFILSLLFLSAFDVTDIEGTKIIHYIHGPWPAFNIILAMLFMPMFDALRVFALRMSKGISPLKADRTHLHYYLLDAGCTHSQAVAVIVGTNVVCMAAGYILQDMNPAIVIACCTAINAVVLFFVLQARKKRVARG